ncbi:acyltransferase family protein [Thalassorhabdus alkalitolerans]|uniref:Acyltransferase family protein n=1 Tax=Thalassorhabdus alkalitolerans TaxID=2282697 RepID=A0ABW0YLU6_9BACI
MDLYRQPDRKIRTEIEGLRAVAAILVAVYHIWLGTVSGGVDVFFVVSGFLITTSLIRGLERDNRIDFSNFVLRLSKRLFPAAFTVLFVVTIACLLWLPQVRWSQAVSEVFASALYFQNWQLAQQSVDYLAKNNEASPFQHFWAMSIQGQFYLLWPLVLFISVLLAKNLFKTSIRAAFLKTLLAVFVCSFVYSVYMTEVNQPWAYFDTFTRVWEFCLGGIIALLISNIVLNKSVSLVLGWLGFIGLLSCGIILQVSAVFPGYAALWPTLSAVFILLAGNQGGTLGVHRVLSSKPLVKFGSISYGFYLWHWPVLIFYYILTGNEVVSIFHGVLLIVLATLLAHLTTRFVETPIRKGKRLNTKWKTGAASAAFLVPVLLLSSLWYGTIQYMAHGASSTISVEGELQNKDEGVTPTPLQARDDVPRIYNEDCHQGEGKSEVIECKYGNTENPAITLALVGGSHSAHWLPALEVIAGEEDIEVRSYTKSGCRFSTDQREDKEDCQEWNDNMMEVLLSEKPDLVFTTADATELDEVPKGYVEHWETLNEEEIPVFAVRDNPRFEFDPPSCVEENGPYAQECAIDREEILPSNSPWEKLDNPPSNVHYADLSDSFCEEDVCYSVVDNVLVYRDFHHLTATFSKKIAPELKEELLPVLNNLQ